MLPFFRARRARSRIDATGLHPADLDDLQRATDAVFDAPRDLKRRRALADTLVRLGRIDEAVGHYQAIVGALAAQGLLFRAIAVCKTILELAPHHTETTTTLASLYARHEDGRDADARPTTLPPAMARALMPATPTDDDDDDDDNDDNDDPGADDIVSIDGDGDDVIDAGVLAAITVLPEGSVRLERPEAVPLFSGLSPALFAELLLALRAQEADAGAVIVAEGEPGASLFVIARGEVQVERAGPSGPVPLARLGAGAFFGEIAIVAERPRAATVQALTRTWLLEIDVAALNALCAQDPAVRVMLDAFCADRLIESTVRTSPLFADLDAADQRRVMQAMTPLVVDDGAVVIAQGSPTPGLHVVLSGAVDVVAEGGIGSGVSSVRLKRLPVGDVFGEMGLVSSSPARATCRAVGKTRLARLDAATFGELQGALPGLRAGLVRLSEDRTAFNARFMPDNDTDDARRGGL